MIRYRSATLLCRVWCRAAYVAWAAVLCCLPGAAAPAAPAGEEIRRLASKWYEEHGGSGSVSEARDWIVERYRAAHPGVPDRPTQPIRTPQASHRAAETAADRAVAEELGPWNEADARARSEKRYPLHPIGSYVRVRYMVTPTREGKASGQLSNRTRDGIKVGARFVLFRDMREVPDYEEEILKFDPEATGALRKQFVAEHQRAYQERRTALRRKILGEHLEREMARMTQINRDSGYLLVDGDWTSLERAAADAARQAQKARQRHELAMPVRRPDTATGSAPAPPDPVTPDAVTSEAEAALNELLASEASTPEPRPSPATSPLEDDIPGIDTGDTAEEPSPEPPPPSAAPAAPPADPLPATPTGPVPPGSPEPSPAGPAAAESQHGLWIKVAAGAVFAVIVTLVAVRLLGPRNRVRVHLARDRFPSPAGSDTPHVALLFVSAERARQALGSLSFLTVAKGDRAIRGPWALDVAFERRADGVCVSLSGTDFPYPAWREAAESLAGVGKECEVLSTREPGRFGLVFPDDFQFPLSCEYDGDDAQYSHYWVFSAPDDEAAEAAMQGIKVSIPGLHVVLETPTARWRRDHEGMRKEPAA